MIDENADLKMHAIYDNIWTRVALKIILKARQEASTRDYICQKYFHLHKKLKNFLFVNHTVLNL